MNPKLKALADELEALRTEIAELDALEAPTEEQTVRFADALGEWDTKKAEHDEAAARAARVEQVRSAALAADKGAANVRTERGVIEAPNVHVRRDTFENLDAVRMERVAVADLRARAMNAIEESGYEDTPDGFREAAIQRMRTASDPDGVARHILLTGSPAYRSAFEKFLRDPQSFAGALTAEESEAMRTAMSTTVGNGGYAIPFLLDPTLILTNGGVANPFRDIATIKQGTSNVWHGLTSAGVTAEWKAEGSVAADASPSFGQPAITAQFADAFVAGSYEVFQDTNIAADLPMLFADAKDRLEADAFAVGSGSGAPKGVVTAVTAVTTSRVAPTTGGTFTTASRADVDRVIEAVPPRHRSRSAWISNYATYGTIRRMDVYGGGSFWANLGAAQPQQLLGLPIYESSQMTAVVTTGSNILLAGNFQNYVIYDRIGATVEYIPNLMDPTTGRPTGSRGYFLNWRVGGDCTNPDAFRVLKL
jgi:HK97 family phage major capsid protein